MLRIERLTVVFLRHEYHGQHLVHAGQPTGVNLTELHGARLQILFEHDFILTMFSCGHADPDIRQGLQRTKHVLNEPVESGLLTGCFQISMISQNIISVLQFHL